ncbi:MAG: ribbon-helix-helix protein, CopG family [Thermodesulfovibrio sp.]|nr:ribbon-helix-helix protein, CopG family [Thermodesulfovibrio sp.]MDW7972441.1 ribbon-helix-helix protein, CopG family [Thermodesulfovibrio sp.]
MKRITTTVRLSKEVKEEIQKTAMQYGRTMGEVIRQIIQEWWIEKKAKEKQEK